MESKTVRAANKISLPEISLPKGGGAIKGIGETFQPDSFSGTAGFSIPVYTSPCRDYEPSISLDYSSAEGSGILGMGFSISIPNISRKTEKGIPRYDHSDIFILSNAGDIVPKADKNGDRLEEGWKVTSYLPRIEGIFAKIELWERGEASYWKVLSRDSVTSIFGQSENARISDPDDSTKVFQWLLEKTYDAKGNKAEYSYKQENTENVPEEIYEQNRIHTANKYISSIRYGNYFDESLLEKWAFEVVFDYGEYNIADEYLEKPDGDPYKPARSRTAGKIPFSSYRSGFEIRTSRLCRSILMFHHLEKELGAEPCLVRATCLEYDESSGITAMLKKVAVKGYRRRADGSYEIKAMPPLEFSYSQFNPQGQPFEELRMENGESISGYIGSMQYDFVDLYGEGIAGFLYSDDSSTFYLEPKGNGKYGSPQSPVWFPIERDLQNADYALTSLAGNGRLELLVNTPQRSGLYEMNPDGTWKAYRSFESCPLDLSNADRQMVDMRGGGLSDLVIFEDSALRIYPSLGLEGFGMAERAWVMGEKDEEFPLTNNGNMEEALGFADMFGDGLLHRVRVRNGMVECWPNLGYGRFGKKVVFGNAPRYGSTLDASRLFFADIDGSGAADIIYVYHDRAEVFLNNGGNSFKDPIAIPLPGIYDSLCSISFVDIKGNGSDCMVFSKMGVEARHYCYDFTGGAKPWLLTGIDNNLGARTHIGYESSVKYYLEDKESGRQWRTKLPFPLQVVGTVETIDGISGSKLAVCYKYHEGFYDYTEREFGGFGYAEQWDTESFDVFSQPGLLTGMAFDSGSSESHVPPVYTRRWYHTGAYTEAESMSEQYREDYYHKDKRAYAMPDSSLDSAISREDGETMRQACRALKGQLLREEIYALDDNADLSEEPYSVMEANYHVRQVQPIGDNKYGAFFSHEKESISYHYERNADDPRIQHDFTLAVDDFANVTKACNVFYPRREAAYPEQAQLKAILDVEDFINNTEGFNLLGISCQSKSYEVGGLDLQGNDYFSFLQLESQVLEAAQNIIQYEEKFTKGKKQTRLLHWERTYFWDEKQEACLDLGQITELALLHHTESAEFSPQLIQAAFDGKVTSEMLEIDGGYVLNEGCWWNRGLVQHHYKEEDKSFYLPWKVENSFVPHDSHLHTKGTLQYDLYCIAPIKAMQYLTEEISNSSSIILDYMTLQPSRITDLNGNISQALFDPLGMVIAASIHGMTGGMPQGDGDLKDYKVITAEGFEDILDNPHKYLQKASEYFYYDVFAWRDRGQPSCFVHLERESHESDLQAGEECRVQIDIGYSDGFGRALEQKVKVDPGEAFLRDEQGNIVHGYAGERWLVSGRTVYNNKGMPFKQYMEYFSPVPQYEKQESVQEALPPPSINWYDPLLRVVRIDTSKGFFSKVEFTPWEEIYFDKADTIKDSDYYREFMQTYPPEPSQRQRDEKDALDKAVLFFNTPQSKVLDSVGNVFMDIQRLSEDEKLITYQELDIDGNTLTAVDPRLYAANIGSNTMLYNMKYVYSMTAANLSIDSADAGLRRTLNNIYGNPIHTWDGRGFHTSVSYDGLQRPLQVRVEGDDGRGTVLNQTVERIVYGEYSEGSTKNLRGQIYKHYDQAGLMTFGLYDIHGNVLQASRRLSEDYRHEANWDNPEGTGLENESFDTAYTYDALGRLTSEKGSDGSIYRPEYNWAGMIQKASVTYEDGTRQVFLDGLEYNAHGQRLKVTYGNGVITKHTYEDTTQNLLGILSTRQGGTALQNIAYTYDPVGNITRVRDHSHETIFNGQQRVEPLSDYSYDGLYRLIGAAGRQHPGIKADTHRYAFKQCGFVPFAAPDINDGKKLENYRESYCYDASGNLTGIRHMAPSASWTRKLRIAESSNRTVRIRAVNGAAEDYETEYDANGNLQGLENLRSIMWSYRNNISRAGIILREDGGSDSEYYVYDGDGNRIRKISERKVSDGIIEIEEKLYLGSFERKRIRRRTETGESTILDREALHITDGDSRIAIVHHWLKDDSGREVDTAGVRKCRYQLDNNLGSSCVEVDENAGLISYEEYYPYGSTSVMAGRSEREVKIKEYRYSGKERDDMTGLYYYGARYYPPWLGRWINPDPAGTVDGLNLYAFVGGNPIRYMDNDGEQRRFLVVGEGTDYSYSIALARHNPRDTVIATQLDETHPPQNIPRNLQVVGGQFDVRDPGAWARLRERYEDGFDAIIFNNPHVGYGLHKFLVFGLTKGMGVNPREAESWDENKPVASGAVYSSGDLFEKTGYGEYRAKRGFRGFNEHIVMKFLEHGQELLSAGGTLEVNIPEGSGMIAGRIDRLRLMGFSRRGNWQGTDYYAEYTSNLTTKEVHRSFGFTHPGPANISEMIRYTFSPPQERGRRSRSPLRTGSHRRQHSRTPSRSRSRARHHSRSRSRERRR